MSVIVSGTYKEESSNSEKEKKGIEIELRIDIDGNHPLNVISGDFYFNSGKTRQYMSSFRYEQVNIKNMGNQILVDGGIGYFSNSPNSPVQILVTIDRDSLTANIEWIDNSCDKLTFFCKKSSNYFRAVKLENDYEQDVEPFTSYDTDLLKAPSPSKGKLSVVDAFRDAGIQINTIRNEANAIRVPQDYSNFSGWTDSELHTAMESNFSKWKNDPQWIVWLFSAKNYENSQVKGMMFDRKGKQRQGCAIFHGIDQGTNDEKRRQLLIYVHELSHCFNLLHPWDRSGASTPGGIEAYSCLSWLNYPWLYYLSDNSCGEDGFWSVFDFKFVDCELLHLRHGFRENVIFGGNDFGTGVSSGFEDTSKFSHPVENKSGLELRIESSKKVFTYGEPVVIEIRLSTSENSAKTHKCLHPKNGLVQFAIRNPNGNIRMFKPLFRTLIDPKEEMLTDINPFYESAYIGYGQDGFYFREPGVYQLRANYFASDRSIIFSNELNVHVQYPHNQEDEEAASLLLDDPQGMLLYLKGSDSDLLQKGNEALNSLIEVYSTNHLATYARFIKGYNIGRWYKKINNSRDLKIRLPNLVVTEKLFRAVVESSNVEGKGLDNISLNNMLTQLAKLQKMLGHEDQAAKTIKQIKEFFKEKRDFKRTVLEEIEKMADGTLDSVAKLKKV